MDGDCNKRCAYVSVIFSDGPVISAHEYRPVIFTKRLQRLVDVNRTCAIPHSALCLKVLLGSSNTVLAVRRMGNTLPYTLDTTSAPLKVLLDRSNAVLAVRRMRNKVPNTLNTTSAPLVISKVVMGHDSRLSQVLKVGRLHDRSVK